MTRLPQILLEGALLSGLVAAPAWAQTQPQTPAQPATHLQGDTETPAPAAVAPERTITFNVEVTPGERGKPIAGLQQSDFTVQDNKSPKAIQSFRALGANSQPVEVLIVIDAVNTMHQNVAYERTQIQQFLRSNGGHLQFPTTLVIFTDRGTQILPHLSQDGNQLSAALDGQNTGLRSIPRSAGFWGADERLSLSVQTLFQLISRESTRPGRKLILWVSPGWPLFSGPHIDLSTSDERRMFREAVALTTAMRQANVTLYGVDPLGTADAGIHAQYYEAYQNMARDPANVEVANIGLQVLAFESGGLEMNSSNDLAGELRRAVDDATAYYQITIPATPGDHPDELHRLQVKVDRPGVVARSWQGYYSSPLPK